MAKIFRDKDKRGRERYVTIISTVTIGDQKYVRVTECLPDGSLLRNRRQTRIRLDTLRKRFEEVK